MKEKIVYQCDQNWVYLGLESIALESPLEPDVFLIPAFSVENPPPAFNPTTHFCVWQNGQWVLEQIPEPPPRPRHEIIAQKTVEIKAKRDLHTQGGVHAQGHWYPSTATAQEQWTFLRGLARDVQFAGGDMDAVMQDSNGNPWRWQTLDNGFVDMTPNLVVEITNTGATNQNQNFQNAKRHIALLEQSENPENYDFSDGWTEIYQE